MTVLQQLGFSGPYSKLTPEQKRACQRLYRARDPHRKEKQRAKYNPEKAAAAWRKYADKNANKLKAKRRAKYWANPEAARAAAAKWAKANSSVLRERRRAHYQANREEVIRRTVEFRKNNPEWLKAYRSKYHKERCARDPGYHMECRMRSRLRELVVKQGGTKSTSLGLSGASIATHLEAQFLTGMSWANYGKAWHVDHIIPCSAFNLLDPKQAQACFSLKNLRPMWGRENIQKSDTILPEHYDLAIELGCNLSTHQAA